MNFANVDIPKEFVPLLSRGLDFKVATKKLPIVDMICGIEEVVKKFTSKAMANEFRFECKRMIQNGQRNRNLNVEQQISAGLGEWLK